MTQPPCEPLVETIQKRTQDLGTFDDQLHALAVDGMNQLHPWRYLALQPQVDHLIKKQLDIFYAPANAFPHAPRVRYACS
jgi:hypothetical protein